MRRGWNTAWRGRSGAPGTERGAPVAARAAPALTDLPRLGATRFRAFCAFALLALLLSWLLLLQRFLLRLPRQTTEKTSCQAHTA